MKLVRAALIAVVVIAVALAGVVTAPPANANNDQVQNCPPDFELSEDQRSCTKTTTPIIPDATCPEGAQGEPGACYVVQPRDEAGPALCAGGVIPSDNGCQVETQQATPTCPAGSMLVPGTTDCATPIPGCTGGRCQTLSRAVPVCPDGFLQRGTDCARFEPPARTFTCRAVAMDIDGECRRAVPTEGGAPICAEGTGSLFDGNCVERVRARRAPSVRYPGPFENMPTVDTGLFGPVYAIAKEEPQTRAEARQERREERAAARATGGLAVTGSTSDATASIAFILLGSGCGVVGSLRRRRTQR